VGNLIVSVFTAIVPFLVVIFEVPLLNNAYREVLIANDMNFNVILGWVGGFAFFAFLSTLIREIIKDIEDFEGDAAYGRNTLPVVLGIRITKIIVAILILITLTALILVYLKFLIYDPAGKLDYLSLTWFVAALAIPYLYLLYRIIGARSKQDCHRCSNLTKTIMLAGILYSFIVYFIIHQNVG
jgi:4-hydroxybenzoate polyprenyltransferase